MGGYTVSFETFRQDADPAPFFAGLPGDRCQCPHWGVVTAGQLTFRWPDHDETYVAGDAYYAPRGICRWSPRAQPWWSSALRLNSR